MPEGASTTGTLSGAVRERLSALLGADGLATDEPTLQLFGQDVFARGAPLVAAAAPSEAAMVPGLVAIAREAGIAIVPRGGGLSYSSGYLATRPGSLLIDLKRLDRIVEVNETDMYVVVEAGVTWAALAERLAPLGLRTSYWGPLSGLRSTVGGALSQNSAFFGSSLYGTAADTVLGLELVLPDGALVRTGIWANRHATPFFRHYGPDLTGLFTGDGGAFGIKLRASLRLIRAPAQAEGVSFAFGAADALMPAMAEVARRGLASECFAFDPVLQSQRMKRESLAKDVAALGAVVKRRGLAAGLRTVAAGRGFVEAGGYSCHCSVEHDAPAEIRRLKQEITRIMVGYGGRPIAATIPEVIRSMPFVPPNSMVGPDGERWVPVHGIVPHSKALSALAAIDDVAASCAEEMARFDILLGKLSVTIGTGATLIEPVFYWPDALNDLHRAEVDADLLARFPVRPAVPGAEAAVAVLRRRIAEALAEAGGSHFQIGKSYPFQSMMQPASWDLLGRIKAAIDPGGLCNPGTLGLG